MVPASSSVQNPNKLQKIRRVANAASTNRGQSLHSNLLTGPHLLNSLLGLLLRFREHAVAILADIESIFMQSAVKQKDQLVLRFFWSKKQFYNSISVHSLDFWGNLFALHGHLGPKSMC